MKPHYRISVLFSLLRCMLVLSASARAPGNNDHDHNHSGGERESDGSFRPRDHDHYTDEGEHRSAFDHEVFLGSVRKAEEFSRMSSDEARRNVREMLAMIDVDGDSFVTRDELKKWILSSFASLAKEEASDRLSETDSNHDGQITWQEYLKDTFGVTSEEQVPDDEVGDTGMLLKEEKEMWAAADKNKDGVLQLDEFSMFVNAEEHAEMHPFLTKQTMREKDTNSDGFIDFQEFVGDRSADQGKDWLVAEKDKFDNDLDTNRDGKLDNAEVKEWIIPDNAELAEEEVDHLFAAADDDHDDLLSMDEILDHIDVFVGSEGNTYGNLVGEHLEDEL